MCKEKKEIQIRINSSETLDKLREDIITLLNKYSKKDVIGYELLGVLEVVIHDVHTSIADEEEE